MRIMTCNIWGDYFHNPVKDRMGGYETLFSEYKPDIVGFQECTAGWYGSGFFEAIEKDYSLYRQKLYADLGAKGALFASLLRLSAVFPHARRVEGIYLSRFKGQRDR